MQHLYDFSKHCLFVDLFSSQWTVHGDVGHPLTQTHNHCILPPLFPTLALFRLFLFFFLCEKADSVTAFPASRGLEPGEGKLCYSLRLQLWEEVTTFSPEAEHRRCSAATENPLKHSLGRLRCIFQKLDLQFSQSLLCGPSRCRGMLCSHHWPVSLTLRFSVCAEPYNSQRATAFLSLLVQWMNFFYSREGLDV